MVGICYYPYKIAPAVGSCGVADSRARLASALLLIVKGKRETPHEAASEAASEAGASAFGSARRSAQSRDTKRGAFVCFCFVALLLLPLNQTGKRAEAKETRSQDPCSF